MLNDHIYTLLALTGYLTLQKLHLDDVDGSDVGKHYKVGKH